MHFHKTRFSRAALLLGALLLGYPAAAGPDIERGRDPLELVRGRVRHRIWVILDTSHSMLRVSGSQARLWTALETLHRTVGEFRSDAGEPLADWALVTFAKQTRDPLESSARCEDPTFGTGLPLGSSGTPPDLWASPCQGIYIRTTPDRCDPTGGAQRLLRRLPFGTNSRATPIGIGLYQLAAHIAGSASANLDPGQRNIILLLTDGEDSCECDEKLWLDFNVGTPGEDTAPELFLRTSGESSEPSRVRSPENGDFRIYNAGLKARAAFRTLGGDHPQNPRGDIFVVGFGLSETHQRRQNHVAWMASGLRRPALLAQSPEELEAALRRAMDVVTLPEGRVALSAPSLASVKELVARSPSPSFAGSDPSRSPQDLVADPSNPASFRRALELRRAYRDNVLLSTAAELHLLRGHLRAKPTPGSGGDGQVIWDAGERLRDRHPDDRTLFFNRPGSRDLIPFEVGEATARDFGVSAGFLSELDGAGARSAADAAEIIVRVTRGEEIGTHPETGRIYDPDGKLHFTGGVGTWKLREGLAPPLPVGSPPLSPERVEHRRDAYRAFFAKHANRRSVLYLPTSGGMLHAFAADTGHEIFAYIPDDVLGPAAWETKPDRTLLRDLVLAAVRPDPGFEVSRVTRFTLAGPPVVRDLWLDGQNRWATVLAFGRDHGGRFLTALDISSVGDGWRGDLNPPKVGSRGNGAPRILFNVGNRGQKDALSGLGHTPWPVLAEVPETGGGIRSVIFQTAGAGAPGDDSGEWLFVLDPGDGRVERSFRTSGRSEATIASNATPAPPAAWSPSFAGETGSSLVTRVFVADVHGQIHRLDTRNPGSWRWGKAFQLGGDQPVLTPPVTLALPGRSEPHLLVVTGGDRRAPGAASRLVMLRESGTRLEEVWRRDLAPGETPRGAPAVIAHREGVDILLVTRLTTESSVGCAGSESQSLSRLRSFDGVTGRPVSGIVARDSSFAELGDGPIQGVSLSSSGNAALSFTDAAGDVVDAVIGDFRFRVSDRALEEITLFVEGFRRSPF